MCVVVSLFFRRLFLGIGRKAEGLTGFDDNPHDTVVPLYKHVKKKKDLGQPQVLDMMLVWALENL